MAVAGFGCQGKGMDKDDDKAERLARALRDNLKRRKAQARATSVARRDLPPKD